MPSYTLRFHHRSPSRNTNMPRPHPSSPPPMHRSISAPPPPTARHRPKPLPSAHAPPPYNPSSPMSKTPPPPPTNSSTISMDSDDLHTLKALNLSTHQVDTSPISSSYTSSPSHSSSSSRQLTPPQSAETIIYDSPHFDRPRSSHNPSPPSPEARTIVIRTRHSDLPGAPRTDQTPPSPRQIPTGKVPHLPPRPSTPVRPHTPHRLPRPRVFIAPNPNRHQNRRTPSVSSSDQPLREPSSPHKTHSAPVVVLRQPLSEPDDNFYFSEDDGSDDENLVDTMKDVLSFASPSEVLSNRVRRAVGALRSISFQTQTIEDLDTAWGQAAVKQVEVQNEKAIAPVSLRWRRPRGRISSRNGVQEFETFSDVEDHSSRSYGSSSSITAQRATAGLRASGSHGPSALQLRQKPSLWGAMRREKSHQHSAVAAQLFVSNSPSQQQRYLAAAVPSSDSQPPATSVVLHYKSEYPDRAVNARRVSGDKYVDFIHASAQRESSRQKLIPKKFPGIVNKAQSVFRRSWK